jgi:erythromycin esterase-like protein
MPSVSTFDEFRRAVDEFVIDDLALRIDADAMAAARASLETTGLLLLGEVHGVHQNPLIIRALMLALGLSAVALEWPTELAPTVERFATDGLLCDHPLLWLADGRVTAGHLSALRERAAAGPLTMILVAAMVQPEQLEGVGQEWSWSDRDAAMASRLLSTPTPAGGMLVVAGNAHTRTDDTSLGTPLGACLAKQRPGVRAISIDYLSGSYFNFTEQCFADRRRRDQATGLRVDDGNLVLTLTNADAAVVPVAGADDGS